MHPITSWFALSVVIIFWHLPRFYELALHSQTWHQVEHACFFWSAVLFWWPVIGVWPSHPIWPRWAMIPYLVLADLVNTGLSAVLCFSDHVLYPTYQLAPRLWGISALGDQAAAGAIMWVPGSIAFLVPALILGMRALEPACLVRFGQFARSASTGPCESAVGSPTNADSWIDPQVSPFSAVRPDSDALTGSRCCARWILRTTSRSAQPRRSAALDPLAWAGRDSAADGRQSVLHGLSIHSSHAISLESSWRPTITGQGDCVLSGSRQACSRPTFGPTRHLLFGTARAPPPGSSSAISPPRSPSIASSGEPAFASTFARSASSISFTHSSRRCR